MDNLFQEGTFITAKKNPDCRLLIDRYIKRIYYCKAVDDPAGKLLVYFERELISPSDIKKCYLEDRKDFHFQLIN